MPDKRQFRVPPQEALPSLQTVITWLAVAIALLLVIELFAGKHGKFAIGDIWGFYAVVSAASCLLVVIAGRIIRALFSKPNDYYDNA